MSNDQPTINKEALGNLAAGLSAMLQLAADRSRKQGQSDHYKELGLEWDESATKIKLPGLPDPMEIDVAIQNLLDFKALSLQKYNIVEFLPGMPYDAAHAFVRVLEEIYGWVNPQSKMTMFGPEPPRMVSVRTGTRPEDFIEVPVGKFKLQNVTAEIETGFRRNPKSGSGSFVSFYIAAEVKHEDRKIVQEIITRTRAYVQENSIYRGKAMRLPVGSDGRVQEDVEPSFIDLTKVSEAGLVLTDINYRLITETVWTPIRKTAVARRHGIPLKRGALLYGEYGTGKTLSALVTAKIAEENGWTFIMLDDPKGLVQALEMAKLYQPAVVFAEDIDRVVEKSRGDKANDVLNTIDGALSKSAEVITVLTTNHIEDINEAMLRPGRLDALIHVTKPDAKAAEKLVRLYAGPLLAPDVPLTALGKLIEVEGYIPAIIAEIVNRGKLNMIFHERNQIVEEDLLVHAELMREHSKLLQKEKKEPSPEEAFGIAAKKLLGDGVSSYNGDLDDDIENIANDVDYAKDYASSAYRVLSEDVAPLIKKLAASGTNGSGNYGEAIAQIKSQLERVAVKVGVV